MTRNIPPHVLNQSTHELYTVQDDMRGYDAHGKSVLGSACTMNVAKAGSETAYIAFEDMVIEADVYLNPDGSGCAVHLICPRCRNNITVRSEHKEVFWDVDRGHINIEAAECPWEVDEHRREFGLSLCKFRFVIDNNVMRAL